MSRDRILSRQVDPNEFPRKSAFSRSRCSPVAIPNRRFAVIDVARRRMERSFPDPNRSMIAGKYQYEIRRIIVYRARESSLGTPTENVAGQTSVNGPPQLSSGVIDRNHRNSLTFVSYR